MANPDHERAVHRAAFGAEPLGDFSNFDLSNIFISSARLEHAQLRNATLCKADLSGAYLKQANLSEANLEKAVLAYADLRQACFTGANLQSADLSSASLQGANLSAANLSRCRLVKAHLEHASLNGAKLAKTDCRGVQGLTPEQIRSASDWQKAIFDESMAHALGITQNVDIARHGPKQRARQLKFTINLQFGGARPNFGDLYRLTGDDHPNFPSSGQCDLGSLAHLGFQQTDDYFAILDGDNSPAIWLYPLVRNHVVEHHPGPFDGLRLELALRTQSWKQRFLEVATQLENVVTGARRVGAK